MKPRGGTVCAVVIFWLVATSVYAGQPAAEKTVAIVVDSRVYPHIADRLQKYVGAIRADYGVGCSTLVDGFYDMKPEAIRARLRAEYEQCRPALVGAIMVGPIPHALRGDPKAVVYPTPLYYEDFDAEWVDRDNDGVFEEVRTDRRTNATEIWTTWWVPPVNDEDGQLHLIAGFLDKLERYHRGEMTGRDQMLWFSGNVFDVEICEGWTVLLKETMAPLDQKLYIWCRVGQDEGTFRPNKRREEFSATDFLTAFGLQTWQHAHIVTHGSPRGWFWDGTGVVAAANEPESTVVLDLAALAGAANIITTSGCSNGNFRGNLSITPDYSKSLANRLLFSPDTVTVAYWGSASPQSTGGFAGYCTELIESLKSDGGSYLAEGYYRMRNHDYSWGTQHYVFRGVDEKILCGDPFVRYHPAPSRTPQEEAALAEKIRAARWTVVGPD